MAFFMIGNNDYSQYINKLVVHKATNYNALTNAAGNTVVDYINQKRIVEVGIIPLDSATMARLQNDIDAFNVSISFRNPQTGTLESLNCIIPENNIEYYTIQAEKVLFNAFQLKFIEL